MRSTTFGHKKTFKEREKMKKESENQVIWQYKSVATNSDDLGSSLENEVALGRECFTSKVRPPGVNRD